MERELTVEQVGSVQVLTLNRPEKRNALTKRLVSRLEVEVGAAMTDDTIAAVVLTGMGNAFCSGADLDEARQREASDPPLNVSLHDIGRLMHRGAKPCIAAVNGHAVGAGLALALMADIRIVSDEARLSAGYIKIGVFPGGGDTYLLPRLIGAERALRMLWTGDPMGGREAVDIGLADRAVSGASVLPESMLLAERLSKSDKNILGMIKKCVYESLKLDFDSSMSLAEGYSSRTSHSSKTIADVSSRGDGYHQ